MTPKRRTGARDDVANLPLFLDGKRVRDGERLRFAYFAGENADFSEYSGGARPRFRFFIAIFAQFSAKERIMIMKRRGFERSTGVGGRSERRGRACLRGTILTFLRKMRAKTRRVDGSRRRSGKGDENGDSFLLSERA